MDEIQKVLIKQGRKDLAQKYYKKVSQTWKGSLFSDQNDLYKVLKVVKEKFENFAFDERDDNPDLDKIILEELGIKVDQKNKDKDYKELEKSIDKIEEAAETVAYKRRISDKPGALKAISKFRSLLKIL